MISNASFWTTCWKWCYGLRIGIAKNPNPDRESCCFSTAEAYPSSPPPEYPGTFLTWKKKKKKAQRATCMNLMKIANFACYVSERPGVEYAWIAAACQVFSGQRKILATRERKSRAGENRKYEACISHAGRKYAISACSMRRTDTDRLLWRTTHKATTFEIHTSGWKPQQLQ